MPARPTQDAVRSALATVLDPELQLPITEMGLIYDVAVGADGTVRITMTLTTVGCPLFDTIHDDIVRAVEALPGVRAVDVELTFDPPWSPEKMSERAKADVGLL